MNSPVVQRILAVFSVPAVFARFASIDVDRYVILSNYSRSLRSWQQNSWRDAAADGIITWSSDPTALVITIHGI
jgi:hypothetical protein